MEIPAPKGKQEPYQGMVMPKAKAATKKQPGTLPDSGKPSRVPIEGESPSESEWSEVQMAFHQSVRMDQMMNHMNNVEKNTQDRMNNIEGALTMIVSQLQSLGLQQSSQSCQQ